MTYTIGKVAQKVGLTTYTLRYYEREGLLPEVQKNERGIRIYTEEDLFWIGLIKCLKETGIPMTQIKYIVELSQVGEETIPQRKEILQQHKVALQEEIGRLEKSVEKIDQKLDWYDGKQIHC